MAKQAGLESLSRNRRTPAAMIRRHARIIGPSLIMLGLGAISLRLASGSPAPGAESRHEGPAVFQWDKASGLAREKREPSSLLERISKKISKASKRPKAGKKTPARVSKPAKTAGFFPTRDEDSRNRRARAMRDAVRPSDEDRPWRLPRVPGFGQSSSGRTALGASMGTETQEAAVESSPPAESRDSRFTQEAVITRGLRLGSRARRRAYTRNMATDRAGPSIAPLDKGSNAVFESGASDPTDGFLASAYALAADDDTLDSDGMEGNGDPEYEGEDTADEESSSNDSYLESEDEDEEEDSEDETSESVSSDSDNGSLYRVSSGEAAAKYKTDVVDALINWEDEAASAFKSDLKTVADKLAELDAHVLTYRAYYRDTAAPYEALTAVHEFIANDSDGAYALLDKAMADIEEARDSAVSVSLDCGSSDNDHMLSTLSSAQSTFQNAAWSVGEAVSAVESGVPEIEETLDDISSWTWGVAYEDDSWSLDYSLSQLPSHIKEELEEVREALAAIALQTSRKDEVEPAAYAGANAFKMINNEVVANYYDYPEHPSRESLYSNTQNAMLSAQQAYTSIGQMDTSSAYDALASLTSATYSAGEAYGSMCSAIDDLYALGLASASGD